MLFYSRSGNQGFEILGQEMPDEQWAKIKRTACQLLAARNKNSAVSLLESIPFELSQGTNYFNDEFLVLHASLPIEEYVKYAGLDTDPNVKLAFNIIAATLSELGVLVRFISIDVQTETIKLVPQPELETTSEVVERALKDSLQLLNYSGPASAVDRIHTALHGYMKAVCIKHNITFEKQSSLTELFKAVRVNHPTFENINTGSEEVRRLVGALSAIIDALNTLRNQASVAHPNDCILGEPEAYLAINCARTLLHYIDSKS